MLLQVPRRLAQQIWIVRESAKAVVTVPAQKAAHFFRFVAVVHRKHLYLAPAHQALRIATNRANTGLRFVHTIPFLGGDPVVSPKIASPNAGLPFLFRKFFSELLPFAAGPQLPFIFREFVFEFLPLATHCECISIYDGGRQ